MEDGVRGDFLDRLSSHQGRVIAQPTEGYALSDPSVDADKQVRSLDSDHEADLFEAHENVKSPYAEF